MALAKKLGDLDWDPKWNAWDAEVYRVRSLPIGVVPAPQSDTAENLGPKKGVGA